VCVCVWGGGVAPHVPWLFLPTVFDHLQYAKAVPGRSCHVSDTIDIPPSYIYGDTNVYLVGKEGRPTHKNAFCPHPVP